MKLVPRETDKLLLHEAGALAQKRLARGLKLNHPEAIALIASVLHEMIRDGVNSVSRLMDVGKKLLGTRQVVDGVDRLVHEVQIEGTFPDGSKLVTVHDPICQPDGDLSLALYGSFLPVPALSVFSSPDKAGSEIVYDAKPYVAIDAVGGTITLNKGRRRIKLQVTSTCDRPIQVGSHFHFIETNAYLEFDRLLSYGMRLDIPAGTAVRFEPGESKTVTLVEIAGNKRISGGNNLATKGSPEACVQYLVSQGFKHKPEPNAASSAVAPLEIEHAKYVSMYGPTVGDKVKLGDTGLIAQIEKDFAVYGDECVFGGGKVIREGMGQANGVPMDKALDIVITNAVIIDYTGIYKADIGIKDGLIAGIGKAGNPDVMAGVTPGMVVGVTTEVIAGEGLIVTAGGLDTHIHFICPQQAIEAISAGLTTMIGGGTGPAVGTLATTCTPNGEAFKFMLQGTDAFPLNFGFTGKGNSAQPEGLTEQILAGAIGLKLHEDWGTTPAAIDACLDIADKYDIQVTIHTDTLNEAGCVEASEKAFKGRTLHTYHTEGAGGGHAPDIIRVASLPNVLPSSTNPTRPYTVNTIDEHVDMLMVCHHLSRKIPEDVAFAESRIRPETIAAEDILHDIGAISMMSSDSQAMGRIGEVITRTWQTAAKMKAQRGKLPEETSDNDNFRIRRYVAKYTINPAISHGVGHVVGSVEVGKVADLVLWNPNFFGSKPEMVVKYGVIAWSMMGDPNASIPTPEPVISRPMFGGFGRAIGTSSIAFVSQASVDAGIVQKYGLTKHIIPVKNTRKIGKKDMKLNDAMPKITVNPETFVVTADGQALDIKPAPNLPLTQRYLLF